ncbi:RICIN domain-containing protein [Streptomyces sp. RFCAC02]|uniref:RICIN domain-containing protein n=1 Tax=Streptomyces sp. RFCAC02 TaxID=2499143 RepID=UPI00101FAEAB|nr:RICIN domain-containing protein [Streptomyces sp. RFCAC02]
MNSLTRHRRSVIVAGLAALLLALSGTLSTASAATTYWTFKSSHNGRCLTGSSSGAVWVASCNGGSSQQWDWVGTGRSYLGQSYHMLKNRAAGECLMTDFKTDRNSVWLSACDGDEVGLWWSNDVPNQLDLYSSTNSLRVSPSGSDAVYTSDWLVDENAYGIPYSSHSWSRSHT